MLINCLWVIIIVVGYLWIFPSVFGYHGIFSLILYILWFVLYKSCWDLYNCWIYNYNYSGVLFNWVELGNNIFVNIGYEIDLLSTLVIIIMSGGSFIIVFVVYIEMWDDKEGFSFVILLIFFLVYMGVLVVSSNLLVFYLGWEGIGLISLFLVSFWTERVRSLKATFKVFYVNKIGDCLLLIVLCIIVGKFGSIDFSFLRGWSIIIMNKYILVGAIKFELIHILSVILVVGGGVKSSQFGFHIWLLEAMEAPLGASALMHSSTLVIAGVLLVYKMYILIELSWVAMGILIIWGSWTALFAASVACLQFELKVILAYSTISSMGFLYMLLGLGAIHEMILYLVLHALIKIFLFLIIGLVMVYCNGVQDIRWIGEIFEYMGWGFILYFWGAIGLGGLPYWSGYYCKSQLWIYISSHYYIISGCHLCIVLTNLCTYIYLIRVGILVFSSCKRGHRSIYRKIRISSSIILLLGILLFVMLYCSIVSLEISIENYQGVFVSWVYYLQFLYFEFQISNYYSWIIMGCMYGLNMLLLLYLIYIWHNSDWSNLRIIWSLQKLFWLVIYIILR